MSGVLAVIVIIIYAVVKIPAEIVRQHRGGDSPPAAPKKKTTRARTT